MYQFISVIAGFRTQQGAAVYQAAQVERYVDDVFFAFTRGMVSVSVAACGGAILYSGFISRLKYTNCFFGEKYLGNILCSQSLIYKVRMLYDTL